MQKIKRGRGGKIFQLGKLCWGAEA